MKTPDPGLWSLRFMLIVGLVAAVAVSVMLTLSEWDPKVELLIYGALGIALSALWMLFTIARVLYDHWRPAKRQ